MVEDEAANGPENPEKGGETRDDAVSEVISVAPSLGAPSRSEIPVAAEAADEFHRRAVLAEDRLSEVLTAYRQLKGENDEYRERTTRNIERRYDQRRERLVLKFIDILDNLDRALEAAEQSYAGNPLIEGLILVRTQLLQTLQEEGLERMPCLGLPFDPALAESVGSQPVEDSDHHMLVVKELARGYRLHGRIARPARVLIGEYAGFMTPPAPVAVPPVAVAVEPLTADALLAAEALPAEEMALAVEEPLPAELAPPLALPSIDESLADEPSADPEELEPLPEPTLQLIPDGEGNSLDEIIAAAERHETGAWGADSPTTGLESDAPLLDGAPLESLEDEDELLREAFGVPDPKAHEK